jgi:subtilisin family serine protease
VGIRCLCALALALVATVVAPAASSAAEQNRYIVVFDQGVQAGQKAAALSDRLGFETAHVYRHALGGFAAVLSDAEVVALRASGAVDYVARDRQVSIAAQTVPTGINRIDAELSPTANINGVDNRVDVDVAVIDTGVDLDHPDLNVFRSKNCTLFGLGSANDDNGHGSHVAGTIGAKDNTSGVVGVAPGARIWAAKVLNAAGIGLQSDIICGIDWVTANAGPIEVANMSLGGGGSDDGNCGNSDGDPEHQAICRSVSAGVTYAVAAGNDSEDAANSAPASYDEVITVSALADFNGQPGGGAASTCRADQDDTFADFSNYGADVDVIAPGVCIESTWMNGGYDTISGTSMASPHVAGAAALYAATHPTATPAQVKAGLIAAGNSNWIWPSQDPDGIREPLINVGGF